MASFAIFSGDNAKENINQLESIFQLSHDRLITDTVMRQQFQECSDKGNKYCSSVLGSIYFYVKNYSKAYPLLVKSEGVLVNYKNGNIFPSEQNLGFMYNDGLGVLQNKDKAIQHYKKCAAVGVDACAYNISVIYNNKSIHNDKYYNLIQSYAWLQVSRALGNNEEIETRIESIKKIIGAQKINEAEELSRKICSTITACLQ